MTSRAHLNRALRLYGVTDRSWLGERSLIEVVSQAIDGGVSFIQLREKEASRAEAIALAHDLKRVCENAEVPFVIDDDVALAREIGADGVHIGQGDMDAARARALLGPDAIIGVSAQTVLQARKAELDGADYLGVGAIFPTSTKDAEVLSPVLFKEICASVNIPVVAIGGLTEQNIPSLKGSGCVGVALVSALFAADDVKQAASRLRAVCDATFGDED